MISRRQFLRGDFSGRSGPATAGGRILLLKADCLAYGSVVCRTCGEACEAGAIRFMPRVGGAAVPEIEVAKCTSCGACVTACPGRAIALR